MPGRKTLWEPGLPAMNDNAVDLNATKREIFRLEISL